MRYPSLPRIQLIVVLLLSFLTTTTLAFADVPSSQPQVKQEVVEVKPKADLPSLPPALLSMLQRGDLAKTKVGVTVVDANTGKLLADYHGADPMNPASNQKLVTTLVALDHFDPGTRVDTTLEGKVVGGVVNGGLVVRGAGAMTLDEAALYGLANQLRQRGITSINGGLIVDEGPLGSGLPPLFDQKEEDAAYRAAVSGLSLSFNGIYVTVEPSQKEGGVPVVIVSPMSDAVSVVNKATTVKGNAWPKITVAEKDGKISVIVEGKIGQRTGTIVKKNRVENPTLMAANVLKYALMSLGIKVDGTPKVEKNVAKRPILATHESDSVAHELYLMNKFSNNFMAEMFFRRLGSLASHSSDHGVEPKWQPYSEENAQKAYATTLKKALGSDYNLVTVKNGSGLYTGNLLPTRAIAKILYYASTQPWGAEFRASLPIAGEDGSLKKRFTSGGLAGNLYAKTGTLNEVSALSGYVTAKSGRPLIVSILFNDTPKFAWLMRREQDALMEGIVKAF